MKNVAPIRRELGVKTFFNMLGPMVNPSFPKKQLVGVFSLELARLYGYLYQKTDKQFVILHALDGYDEVSLTGAFKKITHLQEEIVQPEDLGMNRIQPEAIFGGETVEESAKIFENILKGEGTKAQNNVVIANSAMALQCGKGYSTAEALERATESLESGKALKAFKRILDL
jgi:anthranilate phosphoribosyltransferase